MLNCVTQKNMIVIVCSKTGLSILLMKIKFFNEFPMVHLVFFYNEQGCETRFIVCQSFLKMYSNLC